MLVTTAAISGTRNDVPPKRTMARITKVMAAVTKETIRSPRHNGSDQNEGNFTRTPFYSFPWIVPILFRRCLEFPGDCTLAGSARSVETARPTSKRFARELTQLTVRDRQQSDLVVPVTIEPTIEGL